MSPDKINENDLSENIRILLRTERTHLVEQILTQWPDPTYGDGIAEAFRREYECLKFKGLTPTRYSTACTCSRGERSGRTLRTKRRC